MEELLFAQLWEALRDDPMRYVEDAPLLFFVYVAFIRPTHRRIFAFLRALARNQNAIAKKVGAELPEDTGAFLVAQNTLQSSGQ